MSDLYVFHFSEQPEANLLAESIFRSSGLVAKIRYTEPKWNRVVRLGQLASGTQQLR